MALGIPNRLIVLGLLAAAFVIPQRTTIAGAAVQSTAQAISGSLSALGSTRIEPVFNPSIGLGGNIGERIVSGAFRDDPTGEPAHEIIKITTPQEPVDVDEPYGGGQASLRRLLTSDDLYGN